MSQSQEAAQEAILHRQGTRSGRDFCQLWAEGEKWVVLSLGTLACHGSETGMVKSLFQT